MGNPDRGCCGTSNMYFSFRYPITLFTPQPLNLARASLRQVSRPRLWWLGGKKFSLNPSPWNIKEHAVIYMMANVAPSLPYVINAPVVAEKYHRVTYGAWFELLVLLRDLTGIGLAGLCRGFIVKDTSMIWPQNLAVCALVNALHAEGERETGEMSRLKFFLYPAIGSFLWYFLPGDQLYPVVRKPDSF